MANHNRNFNAGNKKLSELVLRLTFECAESASNMSDFVDNLKTAMSSVKGTTPLGEEDLTTPDIVGRTYNFLAVERHEQIKADCLAVIGRFGNDPAKIVKEFSELMVKMQEAKAKNRKPRDRTEARTEARAEARTEARAEARAEASALPTEESESESSEIEEVQAKPEPEKKPKVVLPKKKPGV